MSLIQKLLTFLSSLVGYFFQKEEVVKPDPTKCISCVWCGNIIYDSDPITLYTIHDPNFKPYQNSILWEESEGGSREFIGCSQPGCCESAADITGKWYWTEDNPQKGTVEFTPNGLELALHFGGSVYTTYDRMGRPHVFVHGKEVDISTIPINRTVRIAKSFI